MLLTESEAKERWCPFARTAMIEKSASFAHTGQELAATVNRDPGDYDANGNETVTIMGRHRCIGSACMAWRWDDGEFETAGPEKKGEPGWQFSYVSGLSGKEVYKRPHTARRGHCGLAGKADP